MACSAKFAEIDKRSVSTSKCIPSASLVHTTSPLRVTIGITSGISGGPKDHRCEMAIISFANIVCGMDRDHLCMRVHTLVGLLDTLSALCCYYVSHLQLSHITLCRSIRIFIVFLYSYFSSNGRLVGSHDFGGGELFYSSSRLPRRIHTEPPALADERLRIMVILACPSRSCANSLLQSFSVWTWTDRVSQLRRSSGKVW